MSNSEPTERAGGVREAARILYYAWESGSDLPEPVQDVIARGGFFSALRLLFDPATDLRQPATLSARPRAPVGDAGEVEITEAMIEAGKAAARDCTERFMDGSEYVDWTEAVREIFRRMSVLAAAPPERAVVNVLDGQLRPPAVKIKALEWSDAAPPNPACRYDHVVTETPFGSFSIEWKGWKSINGFTVYHNGAFLLDEPTLDEAKAAAQADYEARIRSALVTEPAAEPVAWAEQYGGKVVSVAMKKGAFHTMPLYAYPPTASGLPGAEGEL